MKPLELADLSLIISTQQEIATAPLEPATLMELICRRGQQLTNAAGAVVELLENDEMVYVAASGLAANTIGFRLKAGTSLSGLCMNSGSLLICKDSETDPRVNREACRQINVRSMIVVPLIQEDKVTGVLKILSPVPNSFTEREEHILQLMAGLLSSSLGHAQLVRSLQQSERKARHLIDISYGGVCISENGVVVEVNQTFCDIFGYSADEVIGKPTLLTVTPDTVHIAKHNIGRHYDQPYELKGLRKNGSTFPLEVVGKTIIAEGRQMRVASMRDISERKRIEETLKASEMRYRSVLHSVNDSIIAANKDGEIIAWNHAAEKIFGYSQAEAIGQPLMRLMPERFRAKHGAGMQRVARAGETKLSGVPMELVGLRKSGEEFPVELSLATWQQDGETFFTSVIRDLTSKKSAENALSETTKTLKTLINSSPVGILMMDLDFNLQLWNPACEKMFGWSESEVLGKPIPYASVENREASAQIVLSMVATRGKYETQLARARKDGSSINIHIAAMPLLNEQNEVYAHMAILMDISEQVRTNKELLAATKAKSEFLANMSHEIRTPLNGVMGMASLLLDTSLTAEQRDYTESVRSSADTLLTIINDILDFSKVEAGKIDLEHIDFSLDQVVHDIEKTLNFAAQKKGLSLFKSRSPSLADYYKGDPTRIRQVLLNLVANAIKFTPTGHVRIEIKNISTGDAAPRICFEVSDTGIGIPESAIGRMFQAFSQADSSTTRRFGGTGLGLSICKHLVTLMKGEIGVRSSEATGSTFWFVLPLEPGQAPTRDADAEVKKSIGTGPRLRILVAEDVSVNQIIAVKMLERLGHVAVAVANGIEVIDTLRSAPFDIVLMDCQMPEMDGYETTRVIRTSDTLGCKNIPIIAMTANALKGDREKCLASGMDDYITKPVRSGELADVLLKNLKSKLAA